jgi:hypothetical protein
MRYGFNISKKKQSQAHMHTCQKYMHIFQKIMWLKVETCLALRDILCMQIVPPSMSNSMLALRWRKLGRTFKLAMGTKVLYMLPSFFFPLIAQLLDY